MDIGPQLKKTYVIFLQFFKKYILLFKILRTIFKIYSLHKNLS